MNEDGEDIEKLDAAMQALWHLGIVALHDVGSGRGDGFRACRKAYGDAGGPDSGHLGFCYYRRADAEASRHTRTLELVCGDFLDKNLVTRKVQEVTKAALRTAGLDAVVKRGSSGRITLRSFEVRRHGPPPAPPLQVTPEPPYELIAATTAVPARSAPRRRSLLSSAAVPTSPLEKVKTIALGLGAPPIPDAPGGEGPAAEVSSGETRSKPHKPSGLTGDQKRAIGYGLILGGLALIAFFWDSPRPFLGGIFFAALGLVLLILGRKARPQRPARS